MFIQSSVAVLLIEANNMHKIFNALNDYKMFTVEDKIIY